jgi:hypothetical protein
MIANIRGEHDERIGGDREDRRDAIDRKHQVAGLDQHQYQKHRRGPAYAVLQHEKALAKAG